jgi:hypothetical protein
MIAIFGAKPLTRKSSRRCDREGGMVRFGFKIRTKTGQRVDNILILAASLIDAERRLRQMYLQCEILERREQNVRAPGDPATRHATVTRLPTPGERRKTAAQ